MPLPTPKLDDRKFQDIVDEVKRQIPRRCPEWTDHNVSDPGVAMIELFAWMTEMLLYRVNQIPEKNYIKFLEMIGVRLTPPRPARAPITFYLSAPLPDPRSPNKTQEMDAETEVATMRTEASPAIVFATERKLVLRSPELLAAFVGRKDRWSKLLLDKEGMVTDGRGIKPEPMAIFPDVAPGEAIFLALANDVSHHVVAIDLDCLPGEIKTPNNSPIVWEAWQGDWRNPWLPCEIESDQTKQWTQSGEIVMRLPEMKRQEMFGVTAYWLCCRYTKVADNRASYDQSPRLQQLKSLETHGGTVMARHALAVNNELLGQSENTPGQSFKLHGTPVLPLDMEKGVLKVIAPDSSPEEKWREVRDFASSDKDAQHFTLDHTTGEITLGPALLQPDNSIRQFGKIPPYGSQLIFERYQHGGGTIGNVPTGALCELSESLPYIARVVNHQNAVGGRNAQTLDDARFRAPQSLRAADRAVSVEDYELMATEVKGVARALCLGPGRQTSAIKGVLPGAVEIYVLPESEHLTQLPKKEEIEPSKELLNEVKRFLTRRSLPGVAVHAASPNYHWVKVIATLRLSPHAEDRLINQTPESLKTEIETQALTALHRYLNPYTGGPQGRGWPFGRKLKRIELENLLLRIPGIELAQYLALYESEPDTASALGNPVPEIVLQPRELICSTRHEISVIFDNEEHNDPWT